ncbi:hypothetical protein JX265_007206 [Neoarthrinium moseri]|uniref:Uncharacterized protein n=1 Tax=Neoarthrinium moseri TaxID=1658444 RepID=A0A9P9WKU5_9PEZI|nr:uncharacterized protein JN550_013242 [Neoarthrinium moseri]KAI1840405.1 hypothetical protein JX266_013413 [Neoarthrinium moseri]KAI1857362.1 hypothetical protein JN550_013242 [Neoarthrinium moseri]KAI1868383.1 hypothetical protein JX265_007206 [Neoarthrinium moseri]
MNILLAAILALATVTLANFDLYVGSQSHFLEPVVFTVWQIFEAEPDCRQVWDTVYYEDSEDVSGTKAGVRCEGDGCLGGADPVAITTLEMNFHGEDPIYHWTIYKDRNYDMIGLDGKVYGNCILFPGDDYECIDPVIGAYSGGRKFRCLTEFTAAQINDA